MLKAGTCSLTASQDGGTVSTQTYNAADPVIQSFVISKATRTITMKSSTDGAGFENSYVAAGYANWGLTPPSLKSLATAGDSDAKTYSLDPTSTGCEVDADGTTRFVGAGTCKVKVSITGDKYVDAESSVVSFVIGKKDQVISFTALINMTIGDANQDLTSSTNAPGLTVTLSVDPASSGICEIVAGHIRALAAGTCTVNSNQSGNTNYNPATQVQRTFIISEPSSTPPPSSPTPAPVYIPHPPTITKISAAEVCAIGSQLVITGTYLTDAKATVGGVSAVVISSRFSEMTISLPTHPVGTKTIVVTNIDGSANATVEYKFVDSPIYVNFIYPSTYQGQAFTYTFTATNTEKYSIEGVMPAGLTLNPLTGEISGTPTQTGTFLFTIVASNFCDQTYLDVYMFVDKAIPQTYTCSVPFLSPRSNTVSAFRLSELRKCLDDIYTLSPATVAPVIFISGGLPTGLTIEQSLTHPRYVPILELITSMNLNAQIYLGAFSGGLDSVQLTIYWPQP